MGTLSTFLEFSCAVVRIIPDFLMSTYVEIVMLMNQWIKPPYFDNEHLMVCIKWSAFYGAPLMVRISKHMEHDKNDKA